MTVDNFLELATHGGVAIVELLAGSTALLLIAIVSILAGRRQSAAFQHRVWSLSMVCLLALPFLSTILPRLGPESPFLSSVGPDAVGGVGSASALVSSDDTTRVTHGPETTSTMPTSDSSGTLVSPWSLLFILWLSGTCIATILFVRDLIVSRLIVLRAVSVAKGAIIDLKERLCRSADVSLDTSIVCSAETSVPLVIGVCRPVIVLPTGFGKWTMERWQVVLSHEIAHIRRRDILWQAIARLSRLLYWIHPLVWWASRQMRIEREFACDDAVLRMGEIPGDYATHLVDVASALRRGLDSPRATVAIASRSCMERRVRAILRPQVNRLPVARGTGRVLMAAAVTFVVSISLMGPARMISTAADNPQLAQAEHSAEFKLTIRNGSYGTAAFSFRYSTQQVQQHGNQVDLVYDRCGQLHVNAHGGIRHQIADLGDVDFDVEHSVPQQGWKRASIMPRKNHVYVQEIDDGQQVAYVKFLVADIEQDGTLRIKWSPLRRDQRWPPQFRLGAHHGEKGECGGAHPQW